MKFLIFLTLFSFVANAKYCGTIYQGENYLGDSHDLYHLDHIGNLNNFYMADGSDWDNAVSSVFIAPNCTLEMYQYQNFGIHYQTGESVGVKVLLKSTGHHNDYSDLGYFNNKASSIICTCK